MEAKTPFSTAAYQGNAIMPETIGNTPDSTALMNAYKIGDRDSRPWGEYEVIDVRVDNANGEEIVEKIITVKPGQMLSVQSHVGRAEIWTSVQGILSALINGDVVEVAQGQSVDIPKGAIHAMINMGKTAVKVHEVQRGICREEDNTRYFDQSGRDVVSSQDPRVLRSIDTYRRLMATLPAKAASPAHKR